MSWQAVKWAFKAPTENVRDHAALMALADHAHPDGSGAYPSVRTIAQESRQSSRSVRYALSNLITAGLIEATERAGKPTEYRLLMTRTTPAESADPNGLTPAESAHLPLQNLQTTPAESAQTPAESAAKPAKNPSKNQSLNLKKQLSEKSAEDYRKLAECMTTALRKIGQEVDGLTPESQIREARGLIEVDALKRDHPLAGLERDRQIDEVKRMIRFALRPEDDYWHDGMDMKKFRRRCPTIAAQMRKAAPKDVPSSAQLAAASKRHQEEREERTREYERMGSPS